MLGRLGSSEPRVPQTAGALTGFCRMKEKGVLLLPLDGCHKTAGLHMSHIAKCRWYSIVCGGAVL